MGDVGREVLGEGRRGGETFFLSEGTDVIHSACEESFTLGDAFHVIGGGGGKFSETGSGSAGGSARDACSDNFFDTCEIKAGEPAVATTFEKSHRRYD